MSQMMTSTRLSSGLRSLRRRHLRPINATGHNLFGALRTTSAPYLFETIGETEFARTLLA